MQKTLVGEVHSFCPTVRASASSLDCCVYKLSQEKPVRTRNNVQRVYMSGKFNEGQNASDKLSYKLFMLAEPPYDELNVQHDWNSSSINLIA